MAGLEGPESAMARSQRQLRSLRRILSLAHPDATISNISILHPLVQYLADCSGKNTDIQDQQSTWSSEK